MRGLSLPNSISVPISDSDEVVIVSGVEKKPEDVAGDSGIYLPRRQGIILSISSATGHIHVA